MNTTDAKRVLETALICSQQPLPVRELRVLFNDELGADTIKALLGDLQNEWAQRGVELVQVASGWRFQSRPAHARVPGPPASGKAAAVHPRRARDAGHHRLPPAGHARRHGRHPRRDDQRADPQAAGGPRLGRGHRPPRNRRAGPRCSPPPASSWTTWAWSRWTSCRCWTARGSRLSWLAALGDSRRDPARAWPWKDNPEPDGEEAATAAAPDPAPPADERAADDAAQAVET